LETSEERLKKLREYAGDDKVISSFEMADKLAGQKTLFNVRSQITKLDKLIDGFVPGELIMLSGLTKTERLCWLKHLPITFINKTCFPCGSHMSYRLNSFLIASPKHHTPTCLQY